MKKMSLLNQHGRNEVKDDLIADLVSGEISHHFEAIRRYTSHTGGRNVVSNTLETAFFLPWFITGIIFVVLGFIALVGSESEVPIFVTLCCIFPCGIIATMIGFSSVKASVEEVVNPDEYEKYEVTVFFNRSKRYLAEVKVVLDAYDDEIIGDIIFLDEIYLSNKSEILCKYTPGSDGAVRPDYNDFIVSHCNVSIQIDHHTYLGDKERVEIAKEWSEKLGVKTRVPLF